MKYVNVDDPEFKEFSEYVMLYWRPATEMVIRITESGTMFNWLKKWFDFLDDPVSCNDNSILECHKVKVGPYVGIFPYSWFITDDKTESGETIYEFLFLYDSLDHKELTAHQLTLGRGDFIDLQPRVENYN